MAETPAAPPPSPAPPEPRRPGMDHGHYRFSPIVERPPLVWPNGARVALWVLLYLEHWELVPPADAVRDPRLKNANGGGHFPETRAFTYREYGNRVGIFRVLDVLDRYDLKVTVAANSSALERYPNLVHECRQRGWEFVAHGTHATRMISSRMDEAEERAVIRSCLDGVERATGTRPRGWLGQDYGESTRTPRLLAEAGLAYVMDWPNDEQPYAMTTSRPLVSLPTQPDFDDVQALWLKGASHTRYPDMVEAAFETLYADGEGSGRLLSLGIHPWMFGRAHRIRYLDEALARIRDREGIWQATAGEIADYWAATQAD